jgi:molybdopterin synthase sulfur carrier subunit
VSTVTVQLFASYAESFGETFLKISCEPGATVGDLIHRIRALPGAHVLPASPRVAINRKFASIEQRIDAGDEIALIPPVAGG